MKSPFPFTEYKIRSYYHYKQERFLLKFKREYFFAKCLKHKAEEEKKKKKRKKDKQAINSDFKAMNK